MIHQHRCNGQGHGLSPGTGIVAAIVFVVAMSSASAQSLHETVVSVGYPDSRRVHARGKHSADRSCRTLEYRR